MTQDSDMTIQKLKEHVGEFIHAREWEKFHNPKNLAEAICIEAAELLEVFQWVSADETFRQISDPSKLEQIEEELARARARMHSAVWRVQRATLRLCEKGYSHRPCGCR